MESVFAVDPVLDPAPVEGAGTDGVDKAESDRGAAAAVDEGTQTETDLLPEAGPRDTTTVTATTAVTTNTLMVMTAATTAKQSEATKLSRELWELQHAWVALDHERQRVASLRTALPVVSIVAVVMVAMTVVFGVLAFAVTGQGLYHGLFWTFAVTSVCLLASFAVITSKSPEFYQTKQDVVLGQLSAKQRDLRRARDDHADAAAVTLLAPSSLSTAPATLDDAGVSVAPPAAASPGPEPGPGHEAAGAQDDGMIDLLDADVETRRPVWQGSSTVPWRDASTRVRKQELFLDIEQVGLFEFDAEGTITDGVVDLRVLVDAKLSGVPLLDVAFRSGARSHRSTPPARVALQDICVHESASADMLASTARLQCVPPTSRFQLLSARVTAGFDPGFKPSCSVRVDEASGRATYSLTLERSSTAAASATNLRVLVRVPHGSCEFQEIAASPGVLPSAQSSAKDLTVCGDDVAVLVWEVGSNISRQSASIVLQLPRGCSQSDVMEQLRISLQFEGRLNLVPGMGIATCSVKPLDGTTSGLSSSAPTKWLRHSCNVCLPEEVSKISRAAHKEESAVISVPVVV